MLLSPLMALRKEATVYPKKYAHGFVVLCFVVVMQSFIMTSHEVFIHIHQGCFAGTGAIVRLPQCQWSKPDGYGKISQCITTTKHSKAKTVCTFRGIYCAWHLWPKCTQRVSDRTHVLAVQGWITMPSYMYFNWKQNSSVSAKTRTCYITHHIKYITRTNVSNLCPNEKIFIARGHQCI